MTVLVRVGPLPDSAVDAAVAFHGDPLARVIAALEQGRDAVTVVFTPADHTHRGWRLAAVQGLAREHAPVRVNGIASEDKSAVAAAAEYLQRAPAVTGQYFALDGRGAGNPLSDETSSF